mmetsp:Transcript_10381/g.16222  ORF Transcript_10381/g.16222 Transcript_10381/m.16222 type:complete len:328 (+) Transcript_10381:62-1045(+)
MDAQAPSVFTGVKQMPWYEAKGVWLSPPTLALINGKWQVELPAELEGKIPAAELTFDSRDKALNAAARGGGSAAKVYQEVVAQKIEEAEKAGITTGVMLIEAVMHGAGGMYMVDPLFQRIMVLEAQARKIPVVLDEVFAGLWRLGHVSAAQILGVKPDIGCYAKLLTGGSVPMAVTLATEAVFEAFKGQAKTDALLHGHSYTAHPVGCAVGCAALDMYADPKTNPNFQGLHSPMKDIWSPSILDELSHLPKVARVISLGTILAVEIRDEGGSGYQSQASKPIVKSLRQQGIYARPLGNIVYLMVAPTTSQAKAAELSSILLSTLKDA